VNPGFFPSRTDMLGGRYFFHSTKRLCMRAIKKVVVSGDPSTGHRARDRSASYGNS
jgi:hypothetical protein